MSAPAGAPLPVQLRWRGFGGMTAAELHDALRLRCEVFVVEQSCPYADVDGLDAVALHLLAYESMATDKAEGRRAALVGTLRVLPVDAASGRLAPRIGRLAVAAGHRGRGLASAMMREALSFLDASPDAGAVELSAQAHLRRFYEAFGFTPVSDVFDEDGIPHLDMRRASPGG